MQWRKKRTEEIAQVQQPALPEGSVELYTPGGQGAIKAHLAGTMMLIAIGTFGVKQLLRLLILLYQTGLDWIVGSILVAEMDTGMRERFLNTVPKKYLDRIIFGYSKEFASGMANMPIDWILANIKLWGTSIKTAAEDVIDLQLRLNDDHAPGTIYAFVSSGGHVPVGLPAIEIIAQRFEGVPIIAFTSLPHLRRLRERFGRMKSEYEARGVHGWVVVDALCSNLITADTGMVVMLEAMVQAALTADVATQANNVFMMALPEEQGGILIYQVVALSAVAHFQAL